MIGSTASVLVQTPMTTHPGLEPSFCKSLTGHLFNPARWFTCFRYGWNKPVAGWVTHVGIGVGHIMLSALAALAVMVIAVIFLARS